MAIDSTLQARRPIRPVGRPTAAPGMPPQPMPPPPDDSTPTWQPDPWNPTATLGQSNANPGHVVTPYRKPEFDAATGDPVSPKGLMSPTSALSRRNNPYGTTDTVPSPRVPVASAGSTVTSPISRAWPVRRLAPIPAVGTGTPDRRFATIDPSDSSRLTGAQSQTDAAAGKVAGFDPNAAIGSATDDYTKRLATPDVGFDRVDPNVSRQRVDPTVGFQGVNTDVSRRAVDPTVNFTGVNTDVSVGPTVDPSVSADLANYRAKQMAASDTVSSGPSRGAIAQQRLDAFDLNAQPALREGLKSVGQRAAALGRLGMGATSIEALTPYTDYLGKRAALSKDLAAETATGEIGDRLDTLNATEGLVGSQFGQDTSARGEQRTERSNTQNITADNLARMVAERNAKIGVDTGNVTRGMGEADAQAAIDSANVTRRVGERDTALGLAERNTGRAADESAANVGVATGNVTRAMDERSAGVANAQTNAARQAQIRQAAITAGLNAADFSGSTGRANVSTLAGREGQITADEANRRGELRGERGYQHDVGREAVTDAERQQQMEADAQNQDFARRLALADFAYRGNPAGAVAGAGANAGANSASAYQALAQLVAQRRASGG